MNIASLAKPLQDKIRTSPESDRKPLKLVAIGDSLTAGMQDANLCEDRQVHSYPALIAGQAGMDFKQPLINNAGIPPKLFLSPGTSLPKVAWHYAQVAAALAGPVGAMALGMVPPDWTLGPLYKAGGMGKLTHKKEDFQNFAIPAAELRHLNDVHNVHDFLAEMTQGLHSRTEIAALGPYAKYILQDGKGRKNGHSEVDLGIKQKPDVVMFWAGNNDILGAALHGKIDDVALTPMEDKHWDWQTTNLFGKEKNHVSKNVMPGLQSSLGGPNGALTRLLKETKAEIMVMNIPDVTVIPNLRKIGEKVGKLPFQLVLPDGTDVTKRIENWTLPAGIKGPGKDGRENFPAGSVVGMFTVLKKFTHAFKVTSVADVDMAMAAMGRHNAAFSEDDVLDPEETAQVQKRCEEYNGYIHKLAQENPRLHEVDINGLLHQASSEGVALRGQGADITATNTFTGQTDDRGFRGMFSGDGIHPSDVGYAIVANTIMDKARQDLGGNPKFDSLTKAAPVDEKAALAQDPHNAARPTLVLSQFVLDRLLSAAP